jgi:S1-C subfamily serine protease
LLEQIARYKPGDHVSITYRRGGKEYATTVELRNSAGNTSLVREGMNGRILGASVRPLNAEERRNYRVSGGLLVTDPGDGVIAQKTSMRKNFVIVSVNDQTVNSLDQLQQSIANSNGRIQFAGFYPGYKGMYYYALSDSGDNNEQ